MAQFKTSTSVELINKCFFIVVYLIVFKFTNNLVYSHPRLFNGRISYYGNIPGPYGIPREIAFGMPRDLNLQPIVALEPDIGMPPDITGPNVQGLHNLWVKQYVDNFDLDNTKTWKNLYLMNSQFYVPGGPIFLMIRGESPVSRGFMYAGAWTMYAQTYNAMLFQLEQRYYGHSYPTPDLSLENMAYLNVQQTLADLANFIHAMNTKHKFLPSQKWIVFGGSYGGALAVWLRLLYPQLVYGAISSSAPINLVVDFKKYLWSITKTLSAYPGCVSGIKSAYKIIQKQIKSLKGRKKLKHELILCDSFKHPSQSDIATLFYSLSGDFAYVVQYSGDNTNNNNVSIADTCSALSGSKKSPLKGMKKFLKISLEESDANCDGFEYKATIKMLKDTGIKSQNALSGNRQWLYQQCTQLGIFQTSDSKHQVFGDLFPLEYFYKQCTDVFGSNFVPITEITLPYSGLRPNTTNVLCVQGSLDPWRMLGLTKNLTAGVEAIYIQGTGHAADMYEPSPNDVPGLNEARILTSKYIGKLLAKAKMEISTSIPINRPLHTISSSITPTKSTTKKSLTNLLLASSSINSASATLTSVSATSPSNSTSSLSSTSSSSTNIPHSKSLSSSKTNFKSSIAKILKLKHEISESPSSKWSQNSQSSDGKSSNYLKRLILRSEINSLLSNIYGKSSVSSISSSYKKIDHKHPATTSMSSTSLALMSVDNSLKKHDQLKSRKSHITKLRPTVSTSIPSTTVSSALKSHIKSSNNTSSAKSSTAASNLKSSTDQKTKGMRPSENPGKSLSITINKIKINSKPSISINKIKINSKPSSSKSTTHELSSGKNSTSSISSSPASSSSATSSSATPSSVSKAKKNK